MNWILNNLVRTGTCKNFDYFACKQLINHKWIIPCCYIPHEFVMHNLLNYFKNLMNADFSWI